MMTYCQNRVIVRRMQLELFNRWVDAFIRKYGCRKGFCRYYESLLEYKLDYRKHLKDINWSKVSKLVFVCNGNICRSPYAEAKAKLLGLKANSVGLNADNNSSCDPRAIKIAQLHGVNLKSHCSRHFDTLSIGFGDLLIGMEAWHAKKLKSLTNGFGSQITLLGLWANRPRPHIEDPYGLPDDYFNTCFSVMDSAIENILHIIDGAVRKEPTKLEATNDG